MYAGLEISTIDGYGTPYFELFDTNISHGNSEVTFGTPSITFDLQSSIDKYSLNSIDECLEFIEGISYVDETVILGGILNKIIDLIKSAASGVLNFLKKILSKIEGIFGKIFGDIEALLKKLIEKATGVAKIILEKIEAIFGKIAGKILDLIKDALKFVLKIVKLPVDFILSHFLEPIINIVLRRVVVPFLLKDGLIHIPLKDDKIIFDIRLPAMPEYTTEKVDLGFNAGFYTDFRGQMISYPATPMEFSDREGILFQMLVNEYTVASLLDMVLNLDFAHFEMKGNILEKIPLELNTRGISGFFKAPLYKYGNRPINIDFSLLEGSTVTFNEDQTFGLTLAMLNEWFVELEDGTFDLAFSNVAQFNFKLKLNIGANNQIDFGIVDLSYSDFEYLHDNCDVMNLDKDTDETINSIL